MARKLIESPVTTRAARVALDVGVHWRGIDREIHLGYRKGRRGGRWIVRWYQSEAKTYQRIDLGDADDIMSEGTLDYHDALRAAKDAVQAARRKATADAAGPVLTVRLAVETYIASRNARRCTLEGRDVKADADSTLKKHVLAQVTFREKRLDELTEVDLETWRSSIDPTLKGTTRRRILNDLKAALNATFRKERRRLPVELGETIKLGLAAEAIGIEMAEVARENQILADGVVRKIIATAFEVDEDLGTIILVLAATGARFSQLRRMKVRDAQLSMQRLLVPKSHKGRNKQSGYIAVRVGSDVIGALDSTIGGRKPDEPLFMRWRHKQTGPGVWIRDTRGAWGSAAEITRPWATICERVGLNGIVPYALRHSSIVRGIAAGLPIRLVAAMHDTSVAMIEKHYSRWIVDGLEEMSARAIIPLQVSNELIT